MLQITERQFKALDAAVDDVAALAAWLAKRWPTPFETLDPAQRLAMATAAVSRAQAWGARTRVGYFTFAGFMAEFAGDFDRHPAIAAQLRSGPVDAGLRTLAQRVPDEVWSQARRAGSSIGWRLQSVLWDRDPPVRVMAAVQQAIGPAPISATSAMAAVRAAQSLPQGGDHALFVMALATLLDGPDLARRRYDADLSEVGDRRLAVERSAARLMSDHGVWV